MSVRTASSAPSWLGFYGPRRALARGTGSWSAPNTSWNYAQTANSPAPVLSNTDDQLGAFTTVHNRLTADLQAMPDDTRHAVEDAARELRKARAAGSCAKPTRQRVWISAMLAVVTER